MQVGLYPNPTIGPKARPPGKATRRNRSPGQQGGFVEQTIVTAGKLTIAREAACAMCKLASNICSTRPTCKHRWAGYALLSAQKNFESTKALGELTDQLYNVLFLQMKAERVAAYEPMQIVSCRIKHASLFGFSAISRRGSSSPPRSVRRACR